MHTVMEVDIAESHQLSSRLCTDGGDEQLSRSLDAMLCGISVHQSRRSVSTDVGIVQKHDECVADTPENCDASLTYPHTAALECNLSVISREVVPCGLSAENCTGGDVDDSCIAEDGESACTYDCAQSAVTAKLDTSAAHSSTEMAQPECISQSKSLCSAKKSVCFPVDNTESSSDQPDADDEKCVTQQESKHMSLLLRLFESKLFDMAIALPYLFNSKEPGVLAYLG